MLFMGNFSEEALHRYAELCAEKQGTNFAEGDTYDFTRCVKPSGEAYGTRGNCKAGKREDKKVAKLSKHVPPHGWKSHGGRPEDDDGWKAPPEGVGEEIRKRINERLKGA